MTANPRYAECMKIIDDTVLEMIHLEIENAVEPYIRKILALEAELATLLNESALNLEAAKKRISDLEAAEASS